MGRGAGKKQGCCCLHQQHEEGGICYTWHFVFLLSCSKVWEDVAGCFLWCWSHFHSHSAASSKEQLHCQTSFPCRNCCSFLLQSAFLLWNCRSGAGSPKQRGRRWETQAKVRKCIFPLGLAKQTFTTGPDSYHLQQPLLFVPQVCGGRHFLSLLFFL